MDCDTGDDGRRRVLRFERQHQQRRGQGVVRAAYRRRHPRRHRVLHRRNSPALLLLEELTGKLDTV